MFILLVLEVDALVEVPEFKVKSSDLMADASLSFFDACLLSHIQTLLIIKKGVLDVIGDLGLIGRGDFMVNVDEFP